MVITGLTSNDRVRELCARERLLADWVRRCVASERGLHAFDACV